jgi:hypothetical protein
VGVTSSKRDAERPQRAGAFTFGAGVRVSVDRTSVVDGGCRCRDSRHRRPSMGTGYGLFSSVGDRAPAARANPRGPTRPLRRSARPSGPPRLFAPITEKWIKTTVELVSCRRNCSAITFEDVSNANETAASGRRGAESPAAGRRKGGALHRQRHAPHLRFLLR